MFKKSVLALIAISSLLVTVAPLQAYALKILTNDGEYCNNADFVFDADFELPAVKAEGITDKIGFVICSNSSMAFSTARINLDCGWLSGIAGITDAPKIDFDTSLQSTDLTAGHEAPPVLIAMQTFPIGD